MLDERERKGSVGLVGGETRIMIAVKSSSG